MGGFLVKKRKKGKKSPAGAGGEKGLLFSADFIVVTFKCGLPAYNSKSDYIVNRNTFGTDLSPKVFTAMRYIAFAWILSCQIKRRKTFLSDHSSS